MEEVEYQSGRLAPNERSERKTMQERVELTPASSRGNRQVIFRREAAEGKKRPSKTLRYSKSEVSLSGAIPDLSKSLVRSGSSVHFLRPTLKRALYTKKQAQSYVPHAH